MSTELAAQPQEKLDKVATWLAHPDARQKIVSALGNVHEPEYFLSQMVIALETRDDLRACTPVSKFKAANICAALGLLPTLQHVALIPRKNEVTVMPQWQGYHTLFMRTGEVKEIRARLIHRLDTYHFDADSETVTHSYDPFRGDRVFQNFSDLQGGYIRFKMNDGRTIYHCVNVDTIKKARSCAQADNIWTKWFQEQCLKTLYRNAFARRVIHVDTQTASALKQLDEQSDEVEGNDPNRVTAPVIVSASRTETVRNMLAKPVAEAVSAIVSDDQPPFEPVEETQPVQEKAAKPRNKNDQKPDMESRIATALTELERLEPDTAAQAVILDQCGISDADSLSEWNLFTLETLEARLQEMRGK